VETFPLVLGLLFKIIAGKNLVGGCHAFYLQKFNFDAELCHVAELWSRRFPMENCAAFGSDNLISSDELRTK